jgi:hypothetical protein
MIRFKRTAMVALLTGLGFTGTSQAALFDRGGGLIYDDINNVTWLQDANYAQTSGYTDNGLMTYASAAYFAQALVYHDSVRNADYGGWMMPPQSGILYGDLAQTMPIFNPVAVLLSQMIWGVQDGKLAPSGHFLDAAHGNADDSFINFSQSTSPDGLINSIWNVHGEGQGSLYFW